MSTVGEDLWRLKSKRAQHIIAWANAAIVCQKRESEGGSWAFSAAKNEHEKTFVNFSRGIHLSGNLTVIERRWPLYTFVEVHFVVRHVIYFSHSVVLEFCEGKALLAADKAILVRGSSESLKFWISREQFW